MTEQPHAANGRGNGLSEQEASARAWSDLSIEQVPSIWQEAVRRFFANPLAVSGLIIASLIVLCAILADVLSPYPRDVANFSEVLRRPSETHLLGTDGIGRDFLTRVLHGARTSMVVGFSVPLLSTLIGVPLGAYAGWRRGGFDFVLLRVIEILTALPGILVAILLITVWGAGIEKLILFMTVTAWAGIARFARAQFMQYKEREYVTSARALGATSWRMMVHHILPNAAGPLIVSMMTAVPGAIFSEAGLSFLGLGINDPVPSWGKMVADSQQYLSTYWHLAVVPTVLIALTMLAFTFVGDGLRDAFDPYM